MAGGEVILLFALLVRVLGLYSSPLWYDEILSLHRAGLPFWIQVHTHLNLWEIILRAFDTPLLIRIPALVCSMLALWLARRVMVLLEFRPTQRLVGLTVLTFMPGMIWMAQDARYYAGVTLVYIASIYFALQGAWLGLIAVSGISVFVHPTAPAYMIPAWIIALCTLRITTGRQIAMMLMLIPCSWSIYQVIHRNTFWIPAPSVEYVTTQYALSIGMAPYNIVPAIGFVVCVALMAFVKFNPRAWLIYATPLLAILVVSAFILPVAFYRTMQPSLMGLGILIGSAAPDIKRLPYLAPLAILLVWMLAQYDPTVHAGHIERGAQLIAAQWRDGDCIRYGDDFAKTAASELLKGYPECSDAGGRTWAITFTQSDEFAFFATDGWHFPRIYFYLPK